MLFLFRRLLLTSVLVFGLYLVTQKIQIRLKLSGEDMVEDHYLIGEFLNETDSF